MALADLPSADVQGVLILARETGIVIRAAGTLFALPPVPVAAPASDDATGAANGAAATVTSSETARAYAKAARALVDSVGTEVAQLEDGVRVLDPLGELGG